MPLLRKDLLIAKVQEAIATAGWTVTAITPPREHPAVFTMRRGVVEHRVRLYVWNLSHGGKTRSDREYRIQATGVGNFEVEPGGRTVILGWSDAFGAFAAFDASRRLGAVSSSPSIQISAETLDAGSRKGAASQDKGKSGLALAVHPSRLAPYVDRLDEAHSGDLTGIASSDDASLDDVESGLGVFASDEDLSFDFNRPGQADLRAEVARGAAALLASLDAGRPHDGVGGDPGAPGEVSLIGHNGPPEAIARGDGPIAPALEKAARALLLDAAEATPDGREVARAGLVITRAGKALGRARDEGSKVVDKGKDLVREYVVRTLWGLGVLTVSPHVPDIEKQVWSLAEAVLRWLQHVAGKLI